MTAQRLPQIEDKAPREKRALITAQLIDLVKNGNPYELDAQAYLDYDSFMVKCIADLNRRLLGE